MPNPGFTTFGALFDAHGKGDDGELLPDDTYEILNLGAFEMKNKPGLVLKHRVEAGPMAGTVFTTFLSASPAAAGILWKYLKGWGFDEKWLSGADLETVADALKGRVATVTTKPFGDPAKGELVNSIVPGSIELRSAPPLPGVGGVPAAAQTSHEPMSAPSLHQAPDQQLATSAPTTPVGGGVDVSAEPSF